MTKADLVRNVVSILHDNDIKKPVKIPKRTFTISDSEGNEKKFFINSRDKEVYFNKEDVEAVVDACIFAIGESLKRGEMVSVRGVGGIGIKYRKPRSVKDFRSGERIEVPGKYFPYLFVGKELRLCAKMYELSLNETDEFNEDAYRDMIEDIGDDDVL